MAPSRGNQPPPSTLSASSGIGAIVLLTIAFGGLLVGAFVFRGPILSVIEDLLPRERAVRVEKGVATTPGGPVEVGPFWMDRDEVTVARWNRCVLAGQCKAHPGPDDHPVVGLLVEEAEVFCHFDGGRIPKEAEWLLAAGAAEWPWGTEPASCHHAVALGCGDSLKPVGTAWAGATPAGIEDLAGNAWEWSWAADGAGLLLGGGVTTASSELGVRGRKIPTGPETYAGVRCVYDRAPAP